MVKHKLLFILPTYTLEAGAELSNFELMREARERGYDVKAVVAARGPLSRALNQAGIKSIIIPFFPWAPPNQTENKITLNYLAMSKIVALIQSSGTQVVVSNTLNVPWGAFAAAYCNIPHIWVAREFPHDEFSYLPQHYPFISAFSNIVLANSKQLANYLKKPLSPTPVRHFYSFVDASNLRLAPANPAQPSRIVSIGGITARKNQIIILDAVKELQKQHIKPPELLIIGSADPDYLTLFKDTARRYKLEHLITYKPFSAQPWKQVREQDIFLQTSQADSIGRSTTEAMKLGLICIGADIPGTLEAFALGGGIAYRAGSALDLARKIAQVLHDAAPYRFQARQAQQQALKNMSRARCHKPFFQSLVQVSGKPNPSQGLASLQFLPRNISHVLEERMQEIHRLYATEAELRQQVAQAAQEIAELQAQLKPLSRSMLGRVARKITDRHDH